MRIADEQTLLPETPLARLIPAHKKK